MNLKTILIIFIFLLSFSLVLSAVPTQDTPNLLSGGGSNPTINQNAICNHANVNDEDGDNLTRIYGYTKNDENLEELYFPFEVESNGLNASDYADFDNNVSEIVGNVTFKNESGSTNHMSGTSPSPNGAYYFDGGFMEVTGTIPDMTYEWAVKFDIKLNESQMLNERGTILALQGAQYNVSFSVWNLTYIEYNDGRGDPILCNVINLSESDYYRITIRTDLKNKNNLSIDLNGASYCAIKTEYPINNITNIRIGASFNNDSYFRGTIDELKLKNSYYPSAQSLADYQSGYQYLSSKNIEYYDEWTCSIWHHDGTGTNIENITSDAVLIENVAPILDTAVLTSTSTNNLTTDDITITPTQNYTDGDSTKGIIEWYLNNLSVKLVSLLFESDTSAAIAKDSSGNGLNGQINGAIRVYDGDDRGHDNFGAMRFDGVNSLIEIPYNELFSQITNESSISFKLSPDNCDYSGEESYIIIAQENEQYDENSSAYAWGIFIDDYCRVYFNVSTTNETYKLFWEDEGTPLSLQDGVRGNYYTLTAVRNSTTMGLYGYYSNIYGTLIEFNLSQVPLNSSLPIHIGGNVNFTSYYDGKIDDLQIWTRWIKNTTITDLHNNEYYTLRKEEIGIGDNWAFNVSLADNNDISNKLNAELPPIRVNMSLFEASSYLASINWSDIITTYSNLTLNSAIVIGENLVSVNSLIAPDLNKVAKIRFINVSLNNPNLLRNGFEAFGTNLTADGVDYLADVLGFSSYTLTSNNWSTWTRTNTMLSGVNLSRKRDTIINLDMANNLSSIKDISIYENNGTKKNATRPEYCLTCGAGGGSALDFADNGYLAITNDGNTIKTALESGNWTISFWANNTGGSAETILTDGANNYVQLSSIGYRILVYNSSNAQEEVLVTFATTSALRHYALAYNGSAYCGYVSGVLGNCTNYNRGIKWTGTNMYLSSTSSFVDWTGVIDEFKIRDRVMSLTEITQENNSYTSGIYYANGSATYTPCFNTTGRNAVNFTLNASSTNNLSVFIRSGTNCSNAESSTWQQMNLTNGLYTKTGLTQTDTSDQIKIEMIGLTNETQTLYQNYTYTAWNITAEANTTTTTTTTSNGGGSQVIILSCGEGYELKGETCVKKEVPPIVTKENILKTLEEIPQKAKETFNEVVNTIDKKGYTNALIVGGILLVASLLGIMAYTMREKKREVYE